MQDEGKLTPEEIEALLDLEATEGDTATADSGKPNATDNEGKASSELNEDELNADNAVILAKDGKHTIGYEKLVEAREASKHWREQAESAQQELERLQQEAQARAEAGEAPTAQDNQLAQAQAAMDAGIDPEIFGDFSEEALAAGIEKLVAARVQQHLDQALAPLKQKEQVEAADAHEQAILAAHPDAHSIFQSSEFEAWRNSQPEFMQKAYEQVLADGSTQDVIALFNTYKQSNGIATSAAGLQEQARRNMAAAEQDAPTSLSALPGGRVGATSKLDAIQEKSGIEQVFAMMDMSEEELNALI